ncbi:hypothetical protein RHMOL_Rhmol01G0189000 [Rhododendron molle]|uniref:Uncharacterized protein n=1 Tax=Rhododendron molle TaxID=49168 RepID=A0ACC0Q635_RHOML|nr:hypothetical protein RHMOL_Rhmol01G0189000 [Rhododendron molle]
MRSAPSFSPLSRLVIFVNLRILQHLSSLASCCNIRDHHHPSDEKTMPRLQPSVEVVEEMGWSQLCNYKARGHCMYMTANIQISYGDYGL